MTNTEQEGAPVTTEEQPELETPVVSEVTEEVQQPSVPVGGITEDRLQELLAQQKEELTEQFDRSIQSFKDRRLGRLETKVDEALALKDEVETAGGWDQFIAQRQQADAIETRLNAILDARLSQAAAQQPQSQKEQWQAEWTAESQKILDNAAKIGVELTPEEYNGTMFNNGVPFKTKGDAYSALNNAIIAKARGEAITVAAVVTEGGDVAKPPAPPAEPKTAAQRFDEAKASGDYAEMRKVQDERWEEVERQQKALRAQQLAKEAGLSAEDFIEQE